jgi:NADPH2:quinone reductase
MGYVDALVALGGYQVQPPLPFTPGQEVAGRVVEVCGDVGSILPGDRVMGMVFGGGLAQFAAVPAAAVSKLPTNMTFAQAACFRINYLTALHGLRDRARILPGEHLLVLGAAGGVGTAAVQVGRALGARVIAAASTPEKREFARASGASLTIDNEPDGWRDRIKTTCGGRGPDVIFDPVSGPMFELSFRSLAWGGRHLVVGFAGGPIPKLPINLSLMKGASLVGVDVRQFQIFEASRVGEHLRTLLGWVADGEFTVPVGRRFSFEDFAASMEFAMSGRAMAKPIVEIGDP